MRLARRTVPVLCALPALLLAAQAAAAAAPRAVASVERVAVRNGSFEPSLAGWAGYHSTLRRARDGVVGEHAARVSVVAGASDYSIVPASAPVASAVAHTVYRADAWYRSAVAGRPICLRVREWSGGAVVGSSQDCKSTARAWSRFEPVRYTATRTGSSLDVYVFQGKAVRGDSFEVDGVQLAPAGPAPAPAAAAPAVAAAAPSDTRLYSPDSPLNQAIPAGAAVDPGSAAMVSALASEAQRNGFPISSRVWTSTIYYADASTPRYDVALTVPSFLGNKKFASVPIPDAAAASSDSDGGMIVLDRSTGCEYDLGQAQRLPDGSWKARFMNALPLDGSGIYDSALAPSASAFASAAGKILPQELASGEIDHALTFTAHETKAGGPVWPARGGDGWSTAPGALPEGARLQLDPSLDLDSLGLAPWQKTIARAMQVYGLYLVDTGGTFAISAQNSLSPGTSYPWGDADYGYLPPAIVSHLRVLKLGAQQPSVDWRFVTNACARLD